MAYKLFLTERAEVSLEDISEYYITEHSAHRALKVIVSIEEALENILKAPMRHPVCFDIAIPVLDIRQSIVHNTFKIVYRIKEDKIEIIEIFHGNRNINLLKDIK